MAFIWIVIQINSRDGKLLVFLSSKQAVDSGAHNATDSLHIINWPSEWKMDKQLDVNEMVCPSFFFISKCPPIFFLIFFWGKFSWLNYSLCSAACSLSSFWTVPGAYCNVPWRWLFSRPLLFIHAIWSLAPWWMHNDINICLEKYWSDIINRCFKVNHRLLV